MKEVFSVSCSSTWLGVTTLGLPLLRSLWRFRPYFCIKVGIDFSAGPVRVRPRGRKREEKNALDLPASGAHSLCEKEESPCLHICLYL